jgi:predicted transcriptional regulator
MNKTINYETYEQQLLTLEYNLITALIKARHDQNLSQQALSEIVGVKQPVIAKIEKGKHSPGLNTILKLLVPLGYTLEVVKIK